MKHPIFLQVERVYSTSEVKEKKNVSLKTFLMIVQWWWSTQKKRISKQIFGFLIFIFNHCFTVPSLFLPGPLSIWSSTLSTVHCIKEEVPTILSTPPYSTHPPIHPLHPLIFPNNLHCTCPNQPSLFPEDSCLKGQAYLLSLIQDEVVLCCMCLSQYLLPDCWL